jgi:hypothetical protein
MVQKKISPQEITNGSRRSAVSRTRARIAYGSREELGLSAAEIVNCGVKRVGRSFVGVGGVR